MVMTVPLRKMRFMGEGVRGVSSGGTTTKRTRPTLAARATVAVSFRIRLANGPNLLSWTGFGTLEAVCIARQPVPWATSLLLADLYRIPREEGHGPMPSPWPRRTRILRMVDELRSFADL